MKKSKLRIGKKIKSVIALLMCVTLFASCYGGFLSKETIVSPGEGNIGSMMLSPCLRPGSSSPPLAEWQ